MADDDLSWSFPFRRWTRARLEGALEAAGAAVPGARLALADDEDDEDAFELRVRIGRRAGVLRFLSGDAESSAMAYVDADETEADLGEELEGLGDALAGALEGVRAADPRAEDVVAAAVAAETPIPGWDALRAHLAQVYELQEETPEATWVLWSWSDTDRTQLVVVDRIALLDEDWIRVVSTIGPRAALDAAGWEARDLAEPLARLQPNGEVMAWQVALPLGALTPARLDAVLAHVAQLADDLEAVVSTSDDW